MECTPAETMISELPETDRRQIRLTFEIESYNKCIMGRSHRHPYTLGLYK